MCRWPVLPVLFYYPRIWASWATFHWQDFVAILADSDNPNHATVFTFKSSFYLGIYLFCHILSHSYICYNIHLPKVYLFSLRLCVCVCVCVCVCPPPFPGWPNLLLSDNSYIVVFKHAVGFIIFDVYYLI